MLDKVFDQLWIFNAVDAMVNSLNMQSSESLPDVICRTFFSCSAKAEAKGRTMDSKTKSSNA